MCVCVGGGSGREKERNRSEGVKTESNGAAESTPIRNKAVDSRKEKST